MPGKKKPTLYRADVIQAMSLASGESPLSPDDPSYSWRFLAERDSQFTIGAIPSSNLLFELRLRKTAVILNLGYPGDTIANISQLSANTEFSRRLADRRWASDWNAILLSGGGNDLIDRAQDIIRGRPAGTTTASDYIDANALDAFKRDVTAGYEKIVGLRDSANSPNKDKPIFVHTYSYVTPRPAPATFLIVPIAKPWMHPVFEKYKIPKEMRMAVADLLLDELAKALIALGKRLSSFYVVDTRKTLVRADLDAKGNSGDWLNEIHPNTDGYRKVAAKLATKIHAVVS